MCNLLAVLLAVSLCATMGSGQVAVTRIEAEAIYCCASVQSIGDVGGKVKLISFMERSTNGNG